MKHIWEFIKDLKYARLRMGSTLLFLIVVPGILFLSLLLLERGWSIGNNTVSLFSILNNIATLILSIIYICVIFIFIFLLHIYFVHHRPRKYVFEGFSNASELIEVEKRPVDLNNLAREELMSQFQIISSSMKEYIDRLREYSSMLNKDGNSQQPESASKPAFQPKDASSQNGTVYTRAFLNACQDFVQGLPMYKLYKWDWPSPKAELEILASESPEELLDVLNQVRENSLEDSGKRDLEASIEKNAPKEIGPIMAFFDAIIPPRIIKVICHLQWRSDNPEGVGIAFEFFDQKQHGHLMGTLWWQTLEKDAQLLTEPDIISEMLAEEKGMLTERYIKLLIPAMRYLALLLWEQEVISTNRNGHAKDDGEKQPVGFYYLLGALYYASAEQFPVCSAFFTRCAVNRLSTVSVKYPGKTLPYFYLAEIYRSKAKKAPDLRRCQLLREAISWYRRAQAEAKKENAKKDIKNRIMIREVLAAFELRDEQLIEEAEKKIQERTEPGEDGDLTTFDSSIEDCSIYLYNLACWYDNLSEWYDKIKEDSMAQCYNQEMARRCLAYSLARSLRRWNDAKEFKDIFGENGLEALKEALDRKREWVKKLYRELRLEELKGPQFEGAIESILNDRNMPWWNLSANKQEVS